MIDLEEGECPLNIQLRTDSLSGKQLLESYDLQRRSRHIEIRLCWLRRLLNSSILELTFCRGDTNLSDMFTKCVGQALYQSFRTVIGFLLNDLRLSLVISGSEKQRAVDNEEESESLRDLEGKPVGKTTKLAERVFQVFELRNSFERGRRCMLCDDVIEGDLFVEGEGEVFDSVSPSAAVVGSAASSLSGVILTAGVMASSSDKDEDRRSVREAREEAVAKEGVPDAKESKRKRRRHEKKKGKTPGEESKVEKPKEDEMEEVEVEEPVKSSKPPVRSPPVVPPKVKKDHLKDKVEKGKKGKGKGEKGKGKDKGKGKKGKGKAEVASPSKPKRPQEPPTPPPGHAAVEGSKSRNVLAGMGGSPAKPKLDLPGSGFTKSATHRLRCDFCRQRGHIARFCPAVDFRISLTDSSVRPHKREEKPPPQPEESEEEEDVAIHLKERREVRRELRKRAQEAKEALDEEADRKIKEAKGQPHPVTPEEQKVLDRQKQERKEASSYSYYTSSEDEPGEPVRLVPKADVKADPKDPSSSESSSDDGEGEEEEREEDPDGEGSEQSEIFESSVAPVAAGKSAPAPKGKHALVEAKGQKVPVQLPSKPSSGRPKAMPSTLPKVESKRLVDDQDEMKRLEEKSRELEREEEENRLERKRLQKELKELRKKRSAEGAAASVAEEERAKKKKADDEAALQKKAAEKAEREPEESAQKAKKVKKAEKAKAKAEQAKEKLKAERRAVSNLRWHGNRVGMARIDFLHDKPEGWKEMWNERLAAWKAKEKAKKEQQGESGDKEKKSEPERPGNRLKEQRKIPVSQDPWSRPTVFWNGIASVNYPRRKKARDSSTFVDRRDVVRHSRTSLHICNICGPKVTPQAIQVRRLSSVGPQTNLMWQSLATQNILILSLLRNNRRS